MIHANNITKSFGSLSVLKGVQLHIAKSEIAALVGKSGSGKSTLLHILGTLDSPDTGEITINGQETNRLRGKQLSQFRNQSIGFIFQFHHLLPEFNAIENVMMPGLIRGQSEKVCRERASDLLVYLGLKDRILHKPGQLSGGEQQRVAVARALLNSPAVILADEPTGNLDSVNSQEMHELFLRLRDDFGHTFLIATHSSELAAICDRKFEMADGQIS